MKIAELKRELEQLKNEAQTFLNNKDVENAKAKMQEIKDLTETIKMQQELENQEKADLQNKAGAAAGAKATKENASTIRAIIKKCINKPLTEYENSLLIPTDPTAAGTNGEGYLLPTEVITRITEKKRQYRSLREFLGYMPVTALTGSFPVENFETLTGLIDFTDGAELTENNEIKFTNVKYALKEKGALIKLSNTLLALSDNDLIAYVENIFSKKAVITENKLAVEKLIAGKTVKKLNGWAALKSSINKDIDPAAAAMCKIVTNQSGFDFLDSAVDAVGRPILQPVPNDPTKKSLSGYPIEVFSDTMIPNTAAGKAPVFYGALDEAVKFVDNKMYAFATSEHAGFTSNTTLARVITFMDVVQADASDKCYCYAEMDIAAGATAASK